MELSSMTPNMTPLDDLDRKVLQQLRIGGAQTRPTLVAQIDIPRTTLYERLKKLIRDGGVTKFSQSNGKSGRPKVYYQLVPPS